MRKTYVGRNRAENLQWLAVRWLNDGPPVCFLQGFSGVGKTDLARDFRELAEKQGGWQQAVINEIADRPTPSVLESLMELSILLAQQGMPEMEQALFEQTKPSLAQAVEKALQRPVVIILDEAQRFFRADAGRPLPEFNDILTLLRNRPTLPGRLLLLSDRIVEEARWSEWIPKRTLTKLEPDEALEALETKLNEAGVDAEIAPERRSEVVRDLDYNPRAIEALVGALRYDTLDEIIESNPGLWAVRDREVSREFLGALERDLLERTMRHLDEAHRRHLWRLAVHRRSFKREALERLCGGKEKAAELRSVLVSRFLLNFYKGLLAPNPIVREISLAHLRSDPAEFRRAHSEAADYHQRHFKARQMTGTHGKLGASFAELRYHLVQAGRQDELRDIGRRFTDHLKQEIKSGMPVPADPEELNERIGVLTVLLEGGGAKGLEYHLARCLQARGETGDTEQAMTHAELSLGPGTYDPWYLLANLKRQARDTDGAVRVIRRGLLDLSDPGLTTPLYQLGAEILAGAGETDESVALLREGISVVPPDKGLFSLYQVAAEILAKAGKVDEAVALLREGIGVVPPDKNLFTLYQSLSEVLCRAAKPAEAVAVLREGFRLIPQKLGRYRLVHGALYLCAATGDAATLREILTEAHVDDLGPQEDALGRAIERQMQGDWLGAARVASRARGEFSRYFALAAAEAFSRLAAGDAEAAWQSLANFPGFRLETGGPQGWLAAFIHLRRGARAEASEALSTYLGRAVDEGRELNESFLLRLWDQQETAPEGHRLCFHFPILPAALTGLPKDVRRVPFAPPVLPAHVTSGAASKAPEAPAPPADTLEIYVSYAWGEDSTEEGRRREEIVDRLCEAVRAGGHPIGRDKERMRGGDSVERFAQEISRAKRIVAVISEKSLRSDFCMTQELFRAYRRCDYQRAEFQEKVIALVMDDAAPLLKDPSAAVALAVHWRQELERRREELGLVDPDRLNRDEWDFLGLLGEMVPRLPGMLGALRDIVMKRGFDEIVADGFKEVLNRLPARAAE